MNNFNEIYRRIMETLNCHSQKELSKLLELDEFIISDAKRKQIIPDFILLKLFDLFSLHPDYIRTGKGAMFIEK